MLIRIKKVLAIGWLVALLTACGPTATPTPSPMPSATPTLVPTVDVSTPVHVWLTTADQSQLLAQQPDLRFSEQAAGGGKAIWVNENHRYQQMDGFGAAMSDSSAWLLYTQLPADQREKAMAALFSPTEGIGVSVLRLPMGASDFVHGDHYTYDDMLAGQTDPDLAHFSIEHDQAYIIPALKDALKLNPVIKIIASPWSAPAWMKDTGELGRGKLLPEYYSAYANYFVKFIQAYQAEGIPIHAITLQNEPHFEPGTYPGLRLESGEAADFVKNHLGPAFQTAGLQTKILVWDHNWNEPNYPIEVLDDPQAKAYIAGSAFHCYKGTVIAQDLVYYAHPDRELHFTECSDGAWVPSFGEGMKRNMKDLLIGSTRSWAKTVLDWNLALDANSGPHNGGCGNCYGFLKIDPQAPGGFGFQYGYYSFGHASKFVPPGAYRIASTSYAFEGLGSVAYLNPDGSKALIVANTSSAAIPFSVRWGNQNLSYSLPGGAVATLLWEGEQQNVDAPKPPTNLKVRSIAGKLVPNWEFSPLAESYTLQRAEKQGGPYMVVAENITLPEYFDFTFTSGVTYYYVVTAHNAQGTSAISNEASVTP